MTVTEADLKRDAPAEGLLPRHVRGLLWREWLAQRRLIVGAVSIYLIFGWALLVFFHPGWIIAFGSALAMLAGLTFGGADASEGSEEFSFSLPPTRGERYLVRLTLGGVTILALTIFGTLSTALDLPQRLWGIFVETGFTEPFPHVEHTCVYWFAVAIPFAAFAFTFFCSALARMRGAILLSWFLGAVCAGGIFLAGFIIEDHVWSHGVTGYITVPVLFVLGAAVLVLGYFLYRCKEGIARPAPLQAGSGWWILIIVIVAVLVLFFFLSFARYSGVSRQDNAQNEAQERESTLPVPAEGR